MQTLRLLHPFRGKDEPDGSTDGERWGRRHWLILVSVLVNALIVIALGALLGWRAYDAHGAADQARNMEAVSTELLQAVQAQSRQRARWVSALRQGSAPGQVAEREADPLATGMYLRAALARFDELPADRNGSETLATRVADVREELERRDALWERIERSLEAGQPPEEEKVAEWAKASGAVIDAAVSLQDHLPSPEAVDTGLLQVDLIARRVAARLSRHAGDVEGLSAAMARAGPAVSPSLVLRVQSSRDAMHGEAETLLSLRRHRHGERSPLSGELDALHHALDQSQTHSLFSSGGAVHPGRTMPVALGSDGGPARALAERAHSIAKVTAAKVAEDAEARAERSLFGLGAYSGITALGGVLAVASLVRVQRTASALTREAAERRAQEAELEGADAIIRRQRDELAAKVNELQNAVAENARMRERLRSAGARAITRKEASLRRLLTELHDGPAQELALAMLHIDDLRASCESCPSRATSGRSASENITFVSSAVQSALNEIRTYSSGQQPLVDLNGRTLAETVEHAVQRYRKKTRQEVEFACSLTTRDAPEPVKIALYRIVQEALFNGFRHVPGAGQWVFADEDDGYLILEIHDDGRSSGPPPSSNSHGGGLGIAGMRERAELLGGTFQWGGSAYGGTRVHASLPLTLPEHFEEAEDD